MNGNVKDETGATYGMIQVLWRSPDNDKTGGARWVCQCDCGKIVTVRGLCLRKGQTKSCGCGIWQTTHGLTRHELQPTWTTMKQRCYNPKASNYHRYGGRGIGVYEPWKNSLEAFIRDIESTIGPRPTPFHSLDRINNHGNYEPGNLRWGSAVVQLRNRDPYLVIPKDWTGDQICLIKEFNQLIQKYQSED